MEWLLDELTCAAEDANVYDISEVWKRYCAFAEIGKVTICQSYLSRRSTFREKKRLRNTNDFINLEQEILRVPVEFGHVPLSTLLTEPKEPSLIPKYTAPEDFMELIHVVLKVRGNILENTTSIQKFCSKQRGNYIIRSREPLHVPSLNVWWTGSLRS